MKIIHVINSLATGGAEQLVVDLTDHGRRLGHDITIAILKDIPGIPRLKAEELGIPIKVLGASLKDPRLVHKIKQVSAGADIVHVHLFPALYWAGFTSCPRVFTEHNTHNRRMGRSMYRIFERAAYSRYSNIIAISEGVAEAARLNLKNLGLSTEVSLALNGIAPKFFNIHRIYRDHPTRIVSIGSFNPRKQHHLAIEAIAGLKNVTLKIAGDGPLKKEIEERVNALGLSDRVTLLGNVEDIPALLAESDLFLSTSEFEGFGIAAGEAQASGIPVVGPNVAGLREVIPNGVSGLLFNDYDPSIIAETISNALSKSLYLNLATKSRENASRFSIENSFDSQMKVYKAAITQ